MQKEKEKNFSGKRVSILGLGVSGLHAALFLDSRGARVFVSELEGKDAVLTRQKTLAAAGIEVEIGEHTAARILDSDLAVMSPGISPRSEIYRLIKKARPEILVSEIELASWFCPCEMVAVTGTNGKTTTTFLLAEVFKLFGVDAIACGNIGNAFISEIPHLTPDSKAVVEVSSFQLENTRTFRPHVALLLNITPDHIDWHGSMDAYVSAKGRIFRNQTSRDYAILNSQDSPTRGILGAIRSRVVYFNEGPVANPNWDAVMKVADIYGFSLAKTLDFLRTFPGIRHRMEHVASADDLVYINDSKSTNPSSLEWALARMEEPAILISGGRNKGNDFRPLASLIQRKVKACIVFGESAGEMELAWHEAAPVRRCVNLDEALREARSEARPGDTILFSPACASFDQFRNYEERGECFKQMVRSGGRQREVACP